MISTKAISVPSELIGSSIRLLELGSSPFPKNRAVNLQESNNWHSAPSAEIYLNVSSIYFLRFCFLRLYVQHDYCMQFINFQLLKKVQHHVNYLK